MGNKDERDQMRTQMNSIFEVGGKTGGWGAWLLGALVAATSAGCGKGEEAVKRVILKGDDKVLAVVNGSEITEYELKAGIEQKLGQYVRGKLSPENREKILKSLVQSRAIALARENELRPEEVVALDKKVAAYREQLLVKQYLAKHAPPERVSQEMIENYYQENPEKFGARTTKAYELISSSRSLAGAEREELIKETKKASGRKDWKDFAEKLRTLGFPMVYRIGRAKKDALHPDLLKITENLGKGQASPLTFVEGKAFLIRVTEEIKKQPKPLARVRDEIRNSLRPMQLKKSVQKVSEEIMNAAKVVYK